MQIKRYLMYEAFVALESNLDDIFKEKYLLDKI